ncbi:MAG: ribonuclease P protein component [Acidimicrobiia bacterium]|nr:ribonuclease P protein component [Acidimicrobiia bacterium]
MIGRIHGRRAFDRLARGGRRSHAGALWCTYAPDEHLVPLRVAFAIPRAVGSAVTRNRLRRRLRALLAEQTALASGALLVGAKPTAVELTFVQLRDNLRRLVTLVASSTALGTSS